MLHLLPIRPLMIFFGAVIALLVVAAMSVGVLDINTPVESALKVLRWMVPLSAVVIVIVYGSWRWIPAVQNSVFPYLGGTWTGEVRFVDQHGVPDKRNVILKARHTLFGIKLLLESDETESRTLAVHAERPDFDKYQLYYVYQNQRKLGVPGARETYRGVAIVSYQLGPDASLEGDYFTDTHRQGTLHLKQLEKTKFWQIWR